MKTHQLSFKALPRAGEVDPLMAIGPQLALVFADASLLSDPKALESLKAALPGVSLVGCSTAGEISTLGVSNRSMVITALHFDHPHFKLATTELSDMDDSLAAGQRLAATLAQADLNSVLLFAQGVNINGSALIEGLVQVLGPQVSVSGGLAGDAGAFKETWTVSDHAVCNRQVVALGFYGHQVQMRHGTSHGWVPFGVARRVTRCQANVLYELDGEPALEIYKRYLGEYAKDLPASGLLFPFEMLGEDLNAVGLIRTILGIDEANGSLILAGDIIPNGFLKLMHASSNALIDGAQEAAERASDSTQPFGESLALMVSCVGRKQVMGARVDEEVEVVSDVFGPDTQLAGFYSYGEINPINKGLDCKLHNQTMAITHISEVN